jgi:hypothetical protein
MSDITRSEIAITSNGTGYVVPLEPPLDSLLDARQRLIDMNTYCIQKLDTPNIVVKEYWWPIGGQALVPVLVVLSMALFSPRSNFLPGSIFWPILKDFPNFAAFCYKVQPLFIGLVCSIHVVEAAVFAIWKLKPHGVPMFSPLWCVWMISTSLEGFGAFVRFNRLVQEEKIKMAQQKSF